MQGVYHPAVAQAKEPRRPLPASIVNAYPFASPRVLFLRERVLAQIKECVPLSDASFYRTELLMHAVDNGSLAEVKHVLEINSAEVVNAPCSALMITALHLAASKGQDGLAIVKHLIEKGAQPEVADKLGRTALHYAAASGCPELVDILVKAGAPVNCRFQVKKLEDLTIVSVFAHLKKAKKDASKMILVTEDETDSVPVPATKRRIHECIGVVAGKQLPLPECFGRTPLHQAVKGGFLSVVKALLAAGAEVNALDDGGQSPLLLAGAGVAADADAGDIAAYEEIVHVLVQAGAAVATRNSDTGATALSHAAARRSVRSVRCLLDAGADLSDTVLLSGESVLHVAARAGSIQIVELLLSRGARQYVNLQDKVGQTPLHLAAYSGARDVLHLLIRKGGDISISTLSDVSVMSAIFSHVPRPINFLTEALDRCIIPNAASVNDRTFAVKMDFGLLAPRGMSHQMAVVSTLMSGASYYQQMHLFQHPVLETYLRLKWKKLRIFFLFLLAVNLIFVTSLSVYVYLYSSSDCKMDSTKYREISRRVLLGSAGIIFLHSVAQLLMLPRHYIRQYETWISLTCSVLCLAVAIEGEFTSQGFGNGSRAAAWLVNSTAGNCNGTTLTSNEAASTTSNAGIWVTHFLSIAVLLAWAQLMLLIGRFPTWGLYALMFYTVLRNVFKVLLTFVCLVIGFAFSFMIQYHASPKIGFSDPWTSFVKTTVMMMGEFEYSQIFEEGNDRLSPTSRFIFLMFVLLTSIVLMNLMVGLAVSDIQALEKESHIRRGLKQADFVTHLEKFTSHNATRALPRCAASFLENRRSVETELRLQPSVNNTWKEHVSYDLMEAIVAVAILNQTRTGITERKSGATTTTATAAAAASPRVYREDGQRRPPTEDQITVIALLQALQHEVADIRDMLALDGNTAQLASRTAAESAYELQAERSGRPAGVRFSEVANLGMRLRGISHHSELLKTVRNRAARNNVV